MLIEAYEAKHYAVLPPDPIEAIKFRMEQAGLGIKDLEPMIGRSKLKPAARQGQTALWPSIS